MLNRPGVRTDADLHVLGGDLAAAGFWGRLKTLATDLYYRDDHDLVVNTPAMLGGTERTRPIRYWLDTGGEVTHFNYFDRARHRRPARGRAWRSRAPISTSSGWRPRVSSSDDYANVRRWRSPSSSSCAGTHGVSASVAEAPVWIDLLGAGARRAHLARDGRSASARNRLVGPATGALLGTCRVATRSCRVPLRLARVHRT